MVKKEEYDAMTETIPLYFHKGDALWKSMAEDKYDIINMRENRSLSLGPPPMGGPVQGNWEGVADLCGRSCQSYSPVKGIL